MDHQVGCPCGTCAKPYTAADIAPAKEKAAADLRAELLTLRDVKRDHASATEALEIARTALEAHRASMTDASATNALSASLRASLAAYDREADRIDARAAEARREGDRIKALQAKENPYAPIKARHEASVVEKGELLKTAQAGASAALVEFEIAEEVCKVFAPAGARAEMLDEVTPYLNAQTAKYLARSRTGTSGPPGRRSPATRPRAEGEVRHRGRAHARRLKFAAISGGEQRKVRIAAALALQDLVASRASKPIPLFVGDEIDNALDPAGVERLTMILQEKARERGTVFIISHSDLKDWVPQVMKVTKTGRGASPSRRFSREAHHREAQGGPGARRPAVFLAQEHAKLTTTDPVVKAVARVTFEPRRAARTQPVEVEITENKHGSIADDILACIIANVCRRIDDLDRRLAELGIEIEV